MRKTALFFHRTIAMALVTLVLANCGRIRDLDSDEAFYDDENNVAAANQAQANAALWYSALEKNVATTSSRSAMSSAVPVLDQREKENIVNFILSSIEVPPNASRAAVLGSESWYGRYGGQNTYQYGTTYNGGQYTVRTRYNPNIQSQAGTATGGGVVTYNGAKGAGAAGLHVGILGVCAGASAISKSSGSYGGCGGCVTWGGTVYSGCY